jgi:hypothetical protein
MEEKENVVAVPRMGPDIRTDGRPTVGLRAILTLTLKIINYKAYLDLWIRTMGMRQQIAYSQNATKLVQNTADDHKYALVCD